MISDSSLTIRDMKEEDCECISAAFISQGWHKCKELYEGYLKEQTNGERDVIIAEYNNEFAGYVTIQWESKYVYFSSNNIPEIKDFNVLIKFRKKGIGTALMDEAERRIFARGSVAGIGVGLTSDYGAAQRLYVKRGYIPDGLGFSKDGKFLEYGDIVTVDDDLNLFFIKNK